MLRRTGSLLVASLALLGPSSAVLEGQACPEPDGGHAEAGIPAPDLFCIPLEPGANVPEASGRALLLPPALPFTVGVDRHGVQQHRFVLELEGLPEPSTLGDFDRYVAWITPPSLAPMARLGTVDNGRHEIATAGFNAFLLLISAEGPDPGDARSGPLALRGTSPSMVLRPHDLPYILAEMSAPLPDGAGDHHDHQPLPDARADDGRPAAGEVQVHLGHGLGDWGVGANASPAWRPPPMHPEVDMPAQMMLLRPEAAPFLPIGGPDPDTSRSDPDRTHIAEARPREEVQLAAGDTLVLEAGPVVRRIGRVELPGYGFNGQIPGPLIRAPQDDTIHVRFRNATPIPQAVHWHGIRLDNAFDGVPGVTQDPVPPGEEFLYEVRLPDEGSYWYHSHLREDVMQDMGLAGTLQVSPADPNGLYNEVDRSLHIVLDDHLVGPEGSVPYGLGAPTHALMGRFGNVLLANGREDWSLEDARPGEVIRFHLTNVASTRTFNLSFEGLPIKLVAGDVGKLPRESWVESIVVAPAERWVVEVRFPDRGRVALENRVQALDHMGARFFPEVDTVGTVEVSGAPLSRERPSAQSFTTLRVQRWLADELEALMADHVHREPDRTLTLDLRAGELQFPLDPLLRWENVFRPAVEWAGTMPDMDWLVSGHEAEWILRDADTGRENMDVDWRFRTGETIKLRLVNNRDATHAMQHPVHIHGQRFVVLAVNGEANPQPSWKDTVLVPVGSVVDLLVEMSNPGRWMIHCHISEHLESGMMAVFEVD